MVDIAQIAPTCFVDEICKPNEIDLLKEKKEHDIVEFNLNLGQIDKDQQKVEKNGKCKRI